MDKPCLAQGFTFRATQTDRPVQSYPSGCAAVEQVANLSVWHELPKTLVNIIDNDFCDWFDGADSHRERQLTGYQEYDERRCYGAGNSVRDGFQQTPEPRVSLADFADGLHNLAPLNISDFRYQI
jgi:hypothetical protein